MQKEAIQVQLPFKEYPSIENSYRDNFVNKIKQEGHDKPHILWVATQKLHGCNFSIHYCGERKVAKYGRRTDFLSNEIPVPCENPKSYFTETFHDIKNTVKNFHNHLDHVFEKVKQTYPETQIIQIYGELFGGAWPVKNTNFDNLQKNLKAIQKGVYYTPNHEFMVFDIQVTTPNSVFWADVIDIPKFLDGKLMHVPIFAQGNFEQMLSIETVIDSTIPELLGLPRLQKNIIEGMVLRPNTSVSNSYGQRVILKKKNDEFAEKVRAPKQVSIKGKDQKASEQSIVPFIEKLSEYLNINRIQSAISKFPDMKDRNKIRVQVCKDICKDAEKDDFKWPQDVEMHKKTKLQFEKLVFKEINSYYAKH